MGKFYPVLTILKTSKLRKDDIEEDDDEVVFRLPKPE